MDPTLNLASGIVQALIAAGFAIDAARVQQANAVVLAQLKATPKNVFSTDYAAARKRHLDAASDADEVLTPKLHAARVATLATRQRDLIRELADVRQQLNDMVPPPASTARDAVGPVLRGEVPETALRAVDSLDFDEGSG